MKSNGSSSNSVMASRLPLTMATASGSKYLGISSSNSLLVSTKERELLRMQVLPADSAAMAGSNSSSSGPLNGPITSDTPYGSRYTMPVCPVSAMNLGTGAATGSIQLLSCERVNSMVPSVPRTSNTCST